MGGNMGLIDFLRLAFKLSIRDMRGGSNGFVLFIIALALGVAAISAVGSLRAALESTIERDARTLLGGDAELRLSQRAPSLEQMAFIKQNAAEISSVITLRAMAYAENDQRNIIEINAVDDAYPLYGSVVLSADSMIEFDELHQVIAPDRPFPLLADSRILDLLEIEIGDALSLGDADFYLAGITTSLPDKSSNALDFGPEVTISAAALAATNLIQPGSVARYYTRLILKEGTIFADFKTAIETEFADAGFRVRGLDRAAPGLDRFFDRIGSFLNLVSLATLVIGGVGAANAVRAFLTRKASSIASLKALGASQALIFTIFLFEALFMAAIGIVIGLMLGAGSLWLLAPLLQDYVPLTANIGIYPLPLLVAAMLGLLVTLIFIIWSLGQAATIPVAGLFRSAGGLGGAMQLGRAPLKLLWVMAALLAAFIGMCWLITPDKRLFFYFIFGLAGLIAGFALIGWGISKLLTTYVAHPKSIPLRLAIAGLSRPNAPAISIALSLGLGLTMLVAVNDLQSNLDQQLVNVTTEDRPSLFVLDLQPSQQARFEAIIGDYNAENQTEISHYATPLMRASITHLNNVPEDKIEPPADFQWVMRGDRGITWSATPMLAGEGHITKGEWWDADYDGDPLVSFDAEAAAAFGLNVGDQIGINLFGRKFDATIANLRYIDWASMNLNFLMVFSPGMLSNAPQSVLSSINAPAEDEAAIERALTDEFNNISVIRVRDVVDNITLILTQMALAVKAIAAVSLLAGLIVLIGALMSEQSMRLHDSIIFKTLGITRWQQMLGWLGEYSFIALLASILAAIAGIATSFYVVSAIMQTPYQFDFMSMLGILILALVLILPIGLAAGFRLLGKSPLTLLRNI